MASPIMAVVVGGRALSVTFGIDDDGWGGVVNGRRRSIDHRWRNVERAVSRSTTAREARHKHRAAPDPAAASAYWSRFGGRLTAPTTHQARPWLTLDTRDWRSVA